MTELTIWEQWWFFATFLPVLVGFIIQKGWSTRTQALVAVVVYVLYGLIGAFLDGQFTNLSWDSVSEILTSLVAVAMIGYTSYSTLWKAFPLPAWVEEKTGGDPMMEVIPRRNEA